MKLVGTVHKVYDIEQKTQSFRCRDFVLKYEDNPLYPQFIKLQVNNDRCDYFENYNIVEGCKVEVDFDIKGRSWTPLDGGEEKYFNSLEAWRIMVQDRPNGNREGNNVQSEQPYQDITQIEDDDLPF